MALSSNEVERPTLPSKCRRDLAIGPAQPVDEQRRRPPRRARPSSRPGQASPVAGRKALPPRLPPSPRRQARTCEQPRPPAGRRTVGQSLSAPIAKLSSVLADVGGRSAFPRSSRCGVYFYACASSSDNPSQRSPSRSLQINCCELLGFFFREKDSWDPRQDRSSRGHAEESGCAHVGAAAFGLASVRSCEERPIREPKRAALLRSRSQERARARPVSIARHGLH